MKRLSLPLPFLLFFPSSTTHSSLLITHWFALVPQDTDINPLLDYLAVMVNNWIIDSVRFFATLFWWLEKLAALISAVFIHQNWWETVLTVLLNALKNVFPTILQSLLFGTGGGGGLLYLALMLAGLCLILPAVGGTRLVDAGRVIIWGVILISLFITSMTGYDLIALLEGMRQSSAQTIITAVSPSETLSELVTQPMQATQGDLNDPSLTLPSTFANTYFPPPLGYDSREAVFVDAGWPFGRWAIQLQVEQASSINYRLEKSREGLLMATLTLFPAMVLLLFGITFAALAAAALVLVVYFLAALPLGFFEFGAPILEGIVKQYAYLFALTLMAAILPGLLVGAGTLTMQGTPTVSQMMAYLPILIIVTIAANYVAQMAYNAMTGTFGIVTASIRMSMGSYAYNAKTPEANDAPGEGMMKLVSFAAVAAATGGTAALLAGATSLTGGESNASNGRSGHLDRQHAFSQQRKYVEHFREQAKSGEDVNFFLTQPKAPQKLAKSVRRATPQNGTPETLELQKLAKDSGLSREAMEGVFSGVREGLRWGHTVEQQREIAQDQVGRVREVKATLPPEAIAHLTDLALAVAGGKALPPIEPAREERAKADWKYARHFSDSYREGKQINPVWGEANAPQKLAQTVWEAKQGLSSPETVRLRQVAEEIKLPEAALQKIFTGAREGLRWGETHERQTAVMRQNTLKVKEVRELPFEAQEKIMDSVIAVATKRPSPQSPRDLADGVQNYPRLVAQDTTATYALRVETEKLNLGKQELQELFTAVRDGLKEGLKEDQIASKFNKSLSASKEHPNGLPEPTAVRLTQLATSVTKTAGPSALTDKAANTAPAVSAPALPNPIPQQQETKR